MVRVSIVVVTKNNEAIIRNCLDHIYKQEFKDMLGHNFPGALASYFAKMSTRQIGKTKPVMAKKASNI